MKFSRIIALLAVTALALVVCIPAFAADYPSMAITLKTSKAGSNVDYIARLLAQAMGKELGVNVVVDNATGQVEAARDMLHARADGYSLCTVNNTVVINDASGDTEFDSINDFKIIGSFAMGVSSWIGMRKDTCEKLGIETLADLIKYASEHPEELAISDRLNSVTNATMHQLHNVGVNAYPIDVGLATDRLTALLSRQIDICLLNYSFYEQYIETGELVCLASCSPKRSKLTPDVPCTYELGYEVACPAINYLLAPKDVSDEVVQKLENALKNVCEDPEFAQKLYESYVEPWYMSSAECTEFLAQSKAQFMAIK